MSQFQSKFIAFVIGGGEGCDYAMACNRDLFEADLSKAKAAQSQIDQNSSKKRLIGWNMSDSRLSLEDK